MRFCCVGNQIYLTICIGIWTLKVIQNQILDGAFKVTENIIEITSFTSHIKKVIKAGLWTFIAR